MTHVAFSLPNAPPDLGSPSRRQPRQGQPTSFLMTDGEQLLLSLEPLLSTPFPPSSSNTPKQCGEVALMCAVLNDAITCFQNGAFATSRRARRLAREAEVWFLAEDSTWLSSFVSICAVLDLDPDSIRLGLRRWRQRALTSPTSQYQQRRAAPGRLPQPLHAW